MPSFRAALVTLSAASLVACSSPTPRVDLAKAAESGAPPESRGTGLNLTSVSPESLSLSGDHVAPQTLDVSYTIPEPKTVSTATLKLYVAEVGDIAKMDVPIQESGRVQFVIEPPQHSLGFVVRFRASCPAGVTDWYTLGQVPLDYDARRADVFRITNVTPQSIPWTQGMDPDNSGAGKRFHVFGPRLTADCTIEGQVNGSTVELNNVLYINKQFEGLLMYRDINYESVSPRYAELKLVIKRTGLMAAITRIPFAVN
jgi:hypothetical protein